MFIDEYLRDFNATQAALRAGYSPKTAYIIGHENLKKPKIREEIDRQIEERAMGKDEVLLRLAAMARGDMGDFLDINSMSFQLDMDKANELGLTPLIKKAKQHTTTRVQQDGTEVENNTIEIELYDAQAALVHLGKHLKLFDDRLNVRTVVQNLTTFDDAIEMIYGDESGEVSDSGA